MDCNLPGSSILGILQARILEWVAIPFSKGSSQSRDRTWVSCISGRFFPSRATRKPTPLINYNTNSDEDKNDTKIITYYKQHRASLVVQMVKNLPATRDTWAQSLDWEDPLEKEMATHSSIPAWRIPLTEEPGRLQSMESQRVRHD